MFPKGAPGIALLLLRTAVGLGVVEDRWLGLEGAGRTGRSSPPACSP